jgi:hypothetical protein
MGKITADKPVKLFFGIIADSKALIDELEPVLVKNWGKIDLKSELVPFTFTNYYEKEMGQNLLRQWIGFEQPVPQENLSKIKRETNEIESRFLLGANRRINLDPGYLALSKVVLASTKDFSHRIYLSNGIHAEITMIYQNKQFTYLPWTYPDYKSDTATSFFIALRNIYSRQLK